MHERLIVWGFNNSEFFQKKHKEFDLVLGLLETSMEPNHSSIKVSLDDLSDLEMLSNATSRSQTCLLNLWPFLQNPNFLDFSQIPYKFSKVVVLSPLLISLDPQIQKDYKLQKFLKICHPYYEKLMKYHEQFYHPHVHFVYHAPVDFFLKNLSKSQLRLKNSYENILRYSTVEQDELLKKIFAMWSQIKEDFILELPQDENYETKPQHSTVFKFLQHQYLLLQIALELKKTELKKELFCLSSGTIFDLVKAGVL